MKRMPDWITCGDNAFHCERCKTTRPRHLPASIPDWTLQGKAFALSHERCPAPPAEAAR